MPWACHKLMSYLHNKLSAVAQPLYISLPGTIHKLRSSRRTRAMVASGKRSALGHAVIASEHVHRDCLACVRPCFRYLYSLEYLPWMYLYRALAYPHEKLCFQHIPMLLCSGFFVQTPIIKHEGSMRASWLWEQGISVLGGRKLKERRIDDGIPD